MLGLYDPDRSQVVVNAGRIDTWESFVSALGPALERQRGKDGASLRLLTGTLTAPTLARQIGDLLSRFPEARWRPDALHSIGIVHDLCPGIGYAKKSLS